MKFFLSFFFSIFAINALAQDRIELRFLHNPHSKYTISNESVSDMKMLYEGDMRELPEELQLTLPLAIESTQFSTQQIEAGKLSDDGSYPITMLLTDQRTLMSFNGSEQIENNGAGQQLVGIPIHGVANLNGDLSFVAADGVDSSSELGLMMRTIFQQMSESNALKGKSVEVGETVTMKMPLRMPIAGAQAVDFIMETLYTLVSIDSGVATFDLGFNVAISAEMEDVVLDVAGSGDGEMLYKIDTHYISHMETEMSMEFRVPLGAGVLKVESLSYTKMQTELNSLGQAQ